MASKLPGVQGLTPRERDETGKKKGMTMAELAASRPGTVPVFHPEIDKLISASKEEAQTGKDEAPTEPPADPAPADEPVLDEEQGDEAELVDDEEAPDGPQEPSDEEDDS